MTNTTSERTYGPDTVHRMIQEVDERFGKRELKLSLRVVVPALWIFAALGLVGVAVIVNAYTTTQTIPQALAQSAVVLSAGSLGFVYLNGYYDKRLTGIVENHHFRKLRKEFDVEDRPLLLALVRIRNESRTKLEPIYDINRSVFTRRALVRKLVEGRTSNLYD